ncbi:MAG: hypothetical protein ACLTOM_06955 [Roseburia sp.]
MSCLAHRTHKRAKDGDQGLNLPAEWVTFSPSPFYTKVADDSAKKYVHQATVDAMAAEGRPFVGVLFYRSDADGEMGTKGHRGTMPVSSDPEAQVVLPQNEERHH